MPDYLGEREFRHGREQALGVLLVNLGTPAAPTTQAVRSYLAEFLSDPRVIEQPRWLWRLILHGVVLRVRPPRSARAYRKIWTERGSPLLVHSRAVAEALGERLGAELAGRVHTALAMSYGEPRIPDALAALHEQRVRRLVVLPLYPQYSATTTASVFDAVTRALRHHRWLPELRFIAHYHDEEAYITALAASVREFWETHGRGERLLFSFHGLPQRYFLAGDPYHCQCQKTARLLAGRLALERREWEASFQSRVGREEWLRPYTDETLRNWGAQGAGRVDVLCPGFAADCLETLEEIAMQNRDDFLAAGGGELRYIPALNDRPDHVAALAALVRRHAAGWPEAEGRVPDDESLAHSRERALAAGAAG